MKTLLETFSAELTDWELSVLKEKKCIPFATNFYISDFKKEFEDTNPDLELLKVYHIDDKNMQLSGKDGAFEILDKRTGRVSVEYFQEKFWYGDWCDDKHITVEFVNGGGREGWGCKLEDVDWLFDFQPNSIKVIKSNDKMGKFRDICKEMHLSITSDPNYLQNIDSGVKRSYPMKSMRNEQYVWVQKERKNKDNTRTWKIWGKVTDWFVKNKMNCTYTIYKKGLNQYKNN